jgi:predicted TIM-barrel fold metal-dependent hydrolase
MRRQVEACADVDLPVVIHTGYQAGIKNDIRNARATLLWSLLRDYPKARFDLFHGSFPYTGDMSVLGKYFPNVWLNMCWMHLMSPEGARRALSEWLDLVPVTKIFAFGGDFRDVEHIPGHLELARTGVARVLADKVTEGRMAEKDAVKVARLLFYENPKKFYGL